MQNIFDIKKSKVYTLLEHRGEENEVEIALLAVQVYLDRVIVGGANEGKEAG